MVRFGILGASLMGRTHAESIRRMPGVQLTAVADLSFDKAKSLAESMGAVPLADPNALIASDRVDAVIIATPTPFHFSQAKAALEHGKHVFVELPMVRRTGEGEQLLQLVKLHNRIVTVHHTQRYFLEYQLIRKKIMQGAVGKPGVIRLSRRTPHPFGWYSNFESSGGVILDAMIHEFDYLLWCFGPVKKIFCKGLHGRRSTEQLDYALALVRLENGAIAHIESSWCHYGQFVLEVEIAGDEGLIRFNNQDSIPLEISILDKQSGGRRYFSESPVLRPASFYLLEGFVRAVEGKGTSPVPVEEGLAAVRLAEAAIQSVENKRPVEL